MKAQPMKAERKAERRKPKRKRPRGQGNAVSVGEKARAARPQTVVAGKAAGKLPISERTKEKCRKRKSDKS